MDFLDFDLTKSIFNGIILAIAIFAYEYLTNNFKKFRKNTVIYVNSKWYDCKEKPIPIHTLDDYPNVLELILTDGKKITTCRSHLLTFNHMGQVVIGFENNPVTHWQYMPSPPLKKTK